MDPNAPRLLVVDDEQGITEFLERCLDAEGYRVATASGGWEAAQLVEQAGADPFAFVLTDLRMPRGDGVELLETIEEAAGPKPAIAVMTAFADMHPAELFGRGACAFFEKPLDIDDVLVRVKLLVTPLATRWALPATAMAPSYKLNLTFGDYAVASRRGELRLGRGGFFVATEGGQPKVGTVLAFTLTLGPRVLSGHARVAWARPGARHGFHPGLGLEILGLTPDTLAFVLGELAHSPQSYIPLGLKPTNVA